MRDFSITEFSIARICARYLSFSRDCFRFCERRDPLVIIEQLCCRFSFFFFKNEQHDTLLIHSTVRTSRTLDIRLLCPAPANAIIASKSSCLSPEGPGDSWRQFEHAGATNHPSCFVPCFIVSASSPSFTRCMSSLCFCVMFTSLNLCFEE